MEKPYQDLVCHWVSPIIEETVYIREQLQKEPARSFFLSLFAIAISKKQGLVFHVGC